MYDYKIYETASQSSRCLHKSAEKKNWQYRPSFASPPPPPQQKQKQQQQNNPHAYSSLIPTLIAFNIWT